MATQATTKEPIEQFLALSAVLTGFTETDLLGTGVVKALFEELINVVGQSVCADLLTAYALAAEKAGRIPAPGNGRGADHPVGRATRAGGAERHHDVVPGQLEPTPPRVAERVRRHRRDADHVVSADAYREGLVWGVIGAHPPAAKQPGFGSWAFPPRGDAGSVLGDVRPAASAGGYQSAPSRSGGLIGRQKGKAKTGGPGGSS